ncbi:hypothetical protein ACL00T_00270 [Curtobacterium flaccumfaciens]
MTRFSFKDDTTTLVADPRSDQSVAVADAKYTNYTLDGNDLVTNVVDAAKREQSRSYKSTNNGVENSTVGAGAGASKTENTYGANNEQSLTQTQTGSGTKGTATYGSGAATAYLPASTTDSSGNETKYEYDGPGNQTSTATGGTGPEAAKAEARVQQEGHGSVRVGCGEVRDCSRRRGSEDDVFVRHPRPAAGHHGAGEHGRGAEVLLRRLRPREEPHRR